MRALGVREGPSVPGLPNSSVRKMAGLCGCTRSQYNILLVSVAFCVLFSAYNTLQNYISSILPGNLGLQSLGVLYGSVILFVFMGPPLVEAVGTRATMVFGAALYVVYMAGLYNVIPALVLALSVVIGLGAAVLWVALGVFLAQNSTATTRGAATGLFWTIFQSVRRWGGGLFAVPKNSPSRPLTHHPTPPPVRHHRQPAHVGRVFKARRGG